MTSCDTYKTSLKADKKFFRRQRFATSFLQSVYSIDRVVTRQRHGHPQPIGNSSQQSLSSSCAHTASHRNASEYDLSFCS